MGDLVFSRGVRAASGYRYPKGGIKTFSTSSASNVGGGISLSINGVFDTRDICNRISKWEERVIVRLGSYVKRVMRNSMKRGKYRMDKRKFRKGMSKAEKNKIKTVPVRSKPGEAPRAWDTALIKESIHWFPGRLTAVVVVGPQKIPGRSGDLLTVLENGGNLQTKRGTIVVAKRPYAKPAEIAGQKILSNIINTTPPIF